MDFFGYMEGALRSGERAAETLMLHSCGLLEKPAPKSSTLRPPLVPRGWPTLHRPAKIPLSSARLESVWRSTPPLTIRRKPNRPSSAQFFATGTAEEWQPRAAALVAESPFAGALEELEIRWKVRGSTGRTRR